MATAPLNLIEKVAQLQCLCEEIRSLANDATAAAKSGMADRAAMEKRGREINHLVDQLGIGAPIIEDGIADDPPPNAEPKRASTIVSTTGLGGLSFNLELVYPTGRKESLFGPALTGRQMRESGGEAESITSTFALKMADSCKDFCQHWTNYLKYVPAALNRWNGYLRFLSSESLSAIDPIIVNSLESIEKSQWYDPVAIERAIAEQQSSHDENTEQ